MKAKILCVTFTLFASVPALAQSIDAGGGFQFMRDPSGEASYPGWFGQVGGNLSPTLGVVGEVAGGSRAHAAGDYPDVTFYSVMGGPRFAASGAASVMPFVQVLVGVATGSASGGLFLSDSESRFAIKPAAGVDVMFTTHVGIRASGFFSRTGMSDGGNQFGFQVGAVLRRRSR
jgi:hypothetical protein